MINEKGIVFLGIPLVWWIVATVFVGSVVTAVGPASDYTGVGATSGKPILINLSDPAVSTPDNEGWYQVAELKNRVTPYCDDGPRDSSAHGIKFVSPVNIVALNNDKIFGLYCQTKDGTATYDGEGVTLTIEGSLIDYCKALPVAQRLTYGQSSGKETVIPNCLKIIWAETDPETWWSGSDDFGLDAGTKILIHKNVLEAIRGVQKAGPPQNLVPGLSNGTIEFTIAPYDVAGQILLGSEIEIKEKVNITPIAEGIGKASIKLPAGTYKAFYEIKGKSFATEVKEFTVSPGQTTKVDLVAVPSSTTTYEISFEPTDAADAVYVSNVLDIIQVSPKGADNIFISPDNLKIKPENGKIILTLTANQSYEAAIKVKGFEEKKIEFKPVKDESQNKLTVTLTRTKAAPATVITPEMKQSKDPKTNTNNIFKKGLSDLKSSK